MAISFLNVTRECHTPGSDEGDETLFSKLNSTVEDYGRFQTQQKQYSKKLKNISKLLLLKKY